MKARPSKGHACENCGHQEGPIKSTGPMFYIGCCWDLQWSGTREQAADLYDYLVDQGQLYDRNEGACGCIDYNGDCEQVWEEDAWICGVCNESYSDADYGQSAKEKAVECCRERLEQQQRELLEEAEA